MITLSEMQVGGTMTAGLLALTLAIQIPRRSKQHTIYSRARWLMVFGLTMIALQFFVQYLFGFRQMGVAQGVFVNLMFFMPCVASISMALLFVQRRGDMKHSDWYIMWGFYFLAAAILIVTVLVDGVPFTEDSYALRVAEQVAAVLFLMMGLFSFVRHCQEYTRMRRAIEEYYDGDRYDLFRWMGLSVILLVLLGLMVPFVIFSTGWPLVMFSVVFISTMYYCATSFQSYGISLDSQRVEEAQKIQQADEAQPAVSSVLSEKDMARVNKAAERWVAEKGFRKQNLTLTVVANELGVQRYLLKAWLQESHYGKLSDWLNILRTEEAQRLLQEHPDWALDAVAEQCGFGSRQYFHKVFHAQTGYTPAKHNKSAES